jgi:hypothetical protein
MTQTWLDPIAAAEYHEHLTAHDPAQDALQTSRERLSHPYDWHTFAYLVHQVEQVLHQEPSFHRLVAVGSGTGYEVAMLKRHLSFQQCILVDLGYRLLSLSRPTFMAQEQFPASCILADYNVLPFITFGDDTVALAFRCLHHAADMPRVLCTLRELFSRLIVVEPIWTGLLRILAQLGVANRPEHVEDHRPQRLTLEDIRAAGWQIRQCRYLLDVPRDRLPGLQRRQGAFQAGDVRRWERGLACGYGWLLPRLAPVARWVGVTNYVIVSLGA